MKKYTIMFIFSLLMMALFAACGGSGGNNNGGGPIVTCPQGTAFQNGYCMNPYGVATNTGSVGFYSENWHDRTLNPVNGGLHDFLKNAMGVCDRNHVDGGLAGCESWTAGAFDMVLQTSNAQANTVQVTFRAKPRFGTYGNYAYSLPSAGQLAGAFFGFPIMSEAGAVRNPLQVNMTLSVINNYQGFEARGYGDYYTQANRSLIQIRVASGKLENHSFEYFLSYRGKDIARGTFVRCNTADCGLARPLGY